MGTRLLERESELQELESALVAAVGGSGSVVLLSGEPGIGKTNLVRAFRRAASGRARVLAGACDDLLTPRTLGPLRDAARSAAAGPLAVALAGDDRDAVLWAAQEELSDPRAPTVLVVEDVHWADEATLDVLRHIGRRVADLPAIVLITYRDDEIGPGHPFGRVLGTLTGAAVHRMELRQLSRAAVSGWAGGTSATAAELYRLTRGNPFYVSEVLAAPNETVPATVVDAVLARVRRLAAPTRQALDQLAVVPSQAELPLARALLGDLTSLAEAEHLGILEVRSNAVGFRHELARHAVESACPASRRMWLNERVLAALLAHDQPDLARVVHHAVQAGDDAAVVVYAPKAARQACAAGAQSQEAALYGHALARRELLEPENEATLCEAYARALYNSGHQSQAVRAAQEAVALREALGDAAALGQAAACLAIWQWGDLQPAAALASAERAAPLLERGGDSTEKVSALIYVGVVLIHLDRDRDGLVPLGAALAMAARLGARRLEPLALIYRGRARLQLGEEAGLAELTSGLELARSTADHDNVMIGYVTVVALLWRLGRYPEMTHYLDEGAEYGRDRDFPTHDRGREAYRYLLLALRGEWEAAESGLRGILGDDPGVLGRHVLPGLARLAVRQGRDDAVESLAVARANAERGQSVPALMATAAAELEHAWLTGGAAPAATDLLRRTEQAGRERERGELLRWLHRLGEPVGPFEGCPQEIAAGLRGDWRGAAASWARIGAPYERALELAESREVEPTLEALRVFDGLGAEPAAARTRRRLREMGVSAVPRGPRAATRTNPAGLTERQVEILNLLATGRTNAEIAAKLVLSVRTVDHHVSAVLAKLGVATRKEAAAAAADITSG